MPLRGKSKLLAANPFDLAASKALPLLREIDDDCMLLLIRSSSSSKISSREPLALPAHGDSRCSHG
jgi:hypothetical protein